MDERSSQHGIDATAIDDEGAPVIIEYKWDKVNGEAVQQLCKYELWFRKHRDRFDAKVFRKYSRRPSKVATPQLVAVGYRFHRTAAVDIGKPVLFLRYGYHSNQTVSLHLLNSEEVKTALLEPMPPRVSKAPHLKVLLSLTTPAARAAFRLLRKRLIDSDRVEKIPGKNRVWYRTADRGDSIQVSFRPTALECFFNARKPLEDPDECVRFSGKKTWDSACDIASLSDVERFLRLVRH